VTRAAARAPSSGGTEYFKKIIDDRKPTLE